MIELRKAYANNDNKYPSSLLKMMNIMRQQPQVKKRSGPKNNHRNNNGNKNENELATCLAQKKKDEEADGV